MNAWWLAGIIVLFFEGLVLSVNPVAWQNAMKQLIALPPAVLRKIGLSFIASAFVLLLLLRWGS